MRKHSWRKFLVACCSFALMITTGVAFAACDEKAEAGPETGIYYYDADDGETYYVTFTDGDKVSMQIGDETVWGQYKLKDDAFSFTLNTNVEVGATYADKTVTVTYNGSQMVFYRSEKYTVSYETNGGSAIEAVKVLNGKTATKPADPVREGYAFLGWYADAEFKTAYSFGAAPVTANTTVYARWSDKLTGAAVYTVDFDLNYEGAETLASVKTIEGKIYDLPADPVRDGYTFRGWWISDYEDAEKLTFLYDETYAFDADTTLFALWESATSSKLATPLPRVSGDSVVWDAVAGVATYEVEVVGPNGNTIVDRSTGATSVSVAFSSYVAGDYTISVRAISTDDTKNSDTAIRHYNNKALARVSQFSVIAPSVLLFNGVEGAESYKITVECGNPLHNHENFNLGASTYFNFADCEMTKGGIAFTVTASAAGRASSVSETFYYDRVLGKIQTFYFDEESETLSWDAVENAADYEVVITTATEISEILTNGKTSVSLKDFPEGAIKVTVSPKTVGYNSVASDVYEYSKVKLTAPTDLTVSGTILSWTAVKGATSYTVLFDGKEYAGITDTQYDLSALSHTNGVDYEVSVKANGATSSSWSDALTVQYYSLSSSIVYFENTVFWHHVVGATSYKVKVNDGEAVTVDAGTTYADVNLTQKGENVISVQYTDDMGGTSDWVSVSVYAYEITFDSRQGTAADSLYLAMGDALVLPESEREGYDLEGWYNVPGAAQVNGKKYVDGSVLLSAGDLILYANWSPKPYNVTYDVTGDIHIDKLGDTVKYMGDYQLAIPTTSDTSLTFLGWYESPNGEGRQFTDAEGYSVTPWDIKGDKTLYPYFVALLEFSLQTDGTYKDTYSVVASADISRVERIVIPETYNGKKVSIIEGNAFRRITTLKTIEIPDTIEIVYYDTAFEGCTSLQAINVYETGNARVERYSSDGGVLYHTSEVAQEGKQLVYAPAALTGSYVIPDGVKSIGINAFSVTHLSSVTIPSTVNNIAQYAFANSRYIADIYFDFGAGEELVIGDDAFAACSSLKSLTLPARATSFNPEMIASSPRLENIYVAEDHETYSSVNGMLCNKDGDTLLYCPVARRGALRIPAGIRTIASEAFKECKNLTSVVIPNYVTTIRDNAFEKCTRIARVTFAGSNSLGSALTVGENVFKDCTSLSSVVFEENSNVVALGDNLFNGCDKLTSLNLPATVRDLTPALFSGCTNLSKLTVHEENPYYATQNSVLYNKSLTEILFYSINLTESTYVLPDAVEKIGANVFQGNVSLETVIIGKNIKEIGANAFDGSPNLKTVVFVKGGTGELTIGDYAFANCSALAGLYVADTKEAAENGEYTLGTPATLRSIGAYAFKSAKLGEVVLSEGLETLGNYAYTQSSLTAISLPASLKTIGDDAFYRCSSLANVTIAANSVLETIGKEAFSRTKLAAFTVPKTVTSVGSDAFSSTDLTGGFTFEEGRTEIISFGSSVFAGSKITEITFPDQCEVFYGMVDYYGTQFLETTLDSASYLKTINNLPANEDYAWEGGVLYDLNNGVKVAVEYIAWSDAEYVIPNTVTYIKPGAFNSICQNSTLAFEEGGTEDLVIGAAAFNNSGLTSVEFPARLARFEDDELWQTMPDAEIYGSWAFEYSKVQTVTFVDTDETPCRLTEIPNGTFNYMDYLTGIVVPRNVKRIGDRAFGIGGMWGSVQLASVTLPEGLEEIGESAFGADMQCECPLEEIVIPSTVKYIGPGAFGICMSLSSVTFAKNEKGECALQILGDGAFRLTAIKSIALPKSLAGSAYLEDENGKETTTPNGKLGDYMFAYCSNLATVEFEDGCPLITAYGNSCFGKCTQYANVTFPVNLETIDAWDESESAGGIKTITIPNKFTAETFRLFVPSLSGVSSFTIQPGNPNLDIEVGGGIYGTISRTEGGQTISERTLLYYPGNNTAESYTVQAGTEVVDDYAFSENKQLKQVTLPEGLLRIGKFAFGVTDYTRSTALESIVIPKTVTELGEGAFAGATHLTSITFVTEKQDNGYETGALKKIGQRAFRGCTALTEIALPDSVTVLGLELQDYGTDPDIRSAVFYGCTSLERVTLPAGVEVLLGLTFTGCDSLQTVDFRTSSNSLSRIAPYAFYQSGIRTLNLSKANKLSEVTEHSFYECKNLSSVTFGTGTEIEIGDYAFAGTSIASLTLPANVTAIGECAFYNVTTLTDVTVAESGKLTFIGEKAFYNTALSSFAFENLVQLEEIGAYAFAETGITSVLLCDTVVTVGDYAFYHCANVADFRLSASISYVGDYAFAGLPLITSVTVAGNDTTIGTGAFEDCSSLESVTLQSGVNSIGNFAFGFTAISTITLPDTVVAFDGNPFPGCPLESIEIQAPNADLVFDSEAGTMLNSDKTLLYFTSSDTTTISFVDSSITSVMPGALAGTKITSITLPDSFTTIADGTFRNCKQLESIVIGKNITRIGNAAFEGCTALANVEFEQGGTQAISIGARAFKGCTALTEIELPDRLRDYGEVITRETTIFGRPFGTEKFNCGGAGIGEFAFEGSGLVHVTYEKDVPDSISTAAYEDTSLAIAPSAFKNCLALVTAEFGKAIGSSGSFYVKEEVEKLPESFEIFDLYDYNLTETSYLYIGEYAFYNCRNLTTVVLQEETVSSSSSSIGEYAFADCSSLVNFGYPTADEETGAVTYSVPTHVLFYRSFCFKGAGLKSFVIPESYNDWGELNDCSVFEGVFQDCVNLETFVSHAYLGTPNALGSTELGARAFKGCTSLKTVVFDVMYVMDESVFEGCTSLESVSITFVRTGAWAKNPLSIGDRVFKDCSSLTSFTVNGPLSSIGASAFEGCSALASFTVPSTVTSIASGAFAGWTAEQQINVSYTDASSIPTGWIDGWNGNAQIVYSDAE